MRRLLDILFSLLVLIVFLPVIVVISAAIYLYDFHSPFYVAKRVGRGRVPFNMVKFRSMVVNADRIGGSSTSAADRRITPMGHVVRRYKLDEIPQFWNVLLGHMSVVGPRPNVPSGVAVYTNEELKLLEVRPGVTDLASIVFSDEGDILRGHADPDAAYDRLIRPAKSRLGLLCAQRGSTILSLRIMWLTFVALFSRRVALNGVVKILRDLRAPQDLIAISKRDTPLMPGLPPGMTAES
jgi:lipopolysaccharide/colanic/teichoic acid biosynthesis glycosyltransferase